MGTKKTVLIVEDDKSLRNALVEVIQQDHILTLEAENGKDGLKIALEKHPDLILLDLLLPIMDGMTALKKIREDSWGKDVPVIILTNVSATEETLVKDMVSYRPLSYLVKADWKIHDVEKMVKDVLS